MLVLCDDHLTFGQALSTLFSAHGLEVAGCEAEPEPCVELLRATPGAVFVTDLHFPGGTGMTVLRRVHDELGEVPTVVVTGEADPAVLRAALEAGADAVALKTDDAEEMERIVRLVDSDEFRRMRREGRSPKVWSRRARAARRPVDRVTALTGRERAVLQRLAAGGTTGSIARELGVRSATVRTHLQNLYYKLNVHSRLELIATALREGLIDRPSEGPDRQRRTS
jgi:two-component system nitrate/nitrite response regulator NarL